MGLCPSHNLLYTRVLTWALSDGEQTAFTDLGVRWGEIPLSDPQMVQASNDIGDEIKRQMVQEALECIKALETDEPKHLVLTGSTLKLDE